MGIFSRLKDRIVSSVSAVRQSIASRFRPSASVTSNPPSNSENAPSALDRDAPPQQPAEITQGAKPMHDPASIHRIDLPSHVHVTSALETSVETSMEMPAAAAVPAEPDASPSANADNPNEDKPIVNPPQPGTASRLEEAIPAILGRQEERPVLADEDVSDSPLANQPRLPNPVSPSAPESEIGQSMQSGLDALSPADVANHSTQSVGHSPAQPDAPGLRGGESPYDLPPVTMYAANEAVPAVGQTPVSQVGSAEAAVAEAGASADEMIPANDSVAEDDQSVPPAAPVTETAHQLEAVENPTSDLPMDDDERPASAHAGTGEWKSVGEEQTHVPRATASHATVFTDSSEATLPALPESRGGISSELQPTPLAPEWNGGSDQPENGQTSITIRPHAETTVTPEPELPSFPNPADIVAMEEDAVDFESAETPDEPPAAGMISSTHLPDIATISPDASREGESGSNTQVTGPSTVDDLEVSHAHGTDEVTPAQPDSLPIAEFPTDKLVAPIEPTWDNFSPPQGPPAAASAVAEQAARTWNPFAPLVRARPTVPPPQSAYQSTLYDLTTSSLERRFIALLASLYSDERLQTWRLTPQAGFTFYDGLSDKQGSADFALVQDGKVTIVELDGEQYHDPTLTGRWFSEFNRQEFQSTYAYQTIRQNALMIRAHYVYRWCGQHFDTPAFAETVQQAIEASLDSRIALRTMAATRSIAQDLPAVPCACLELSTADEDRLVQLLRHVLGPGWDPFVHSSLCKRLAALAGLVDLPGPVLLAQDRPIGFAIDTPTAATPNWYRNRLDHQNQLVQQGWQIIRLTSPMIELAPIETQGLLAEYAQTWHCPHFAKPSASTQAAILPEARLSQRQTAMMLLRSNRIGAFNAWRRQLGHADLNLVGSDLSRANLAGVDLRGCLLVGADLRQSDLSGADLRRTNLARALFDSTVVTGADFRDCDLSLALWTQEDPTFLPASWPSNRFFLPDDRLEFKLPERLVAPLSNSLQVPVTLMNIGDIPRHVDVCLFIGENKLGEQHITLGRQESHTLTLEVQARAHWPASISVQVLYHTWKGLEKKQLPVEIALQASWFQSPTGLPIAGPSSNPKFQQQTISNTSDEPVQWINPPAQVATSSPAADTTATVSSPAAWPSSAADDGARQVFAHLERHGSITEEELIHLLGSHRSVRRFALAFDKYLKQVPFDVRIENTANGKRYVRQ